MVCAERSVESKMAAALPFESKRKTFAGVAPAAGVLGKNSSGKEGKEADEVKYMQPTRSMWRRGHSEIHRIWRLREMMPETGPPSGTEASLANDSRSSWTVPGAGRPSTTLIWENGMFGSSLSSQRSVGAGTKRPTYKRSFLRSRFKSAIS